VSHLAIFQLIPAAWLCDCIVPPISRDTTCTHAHPHAPSLSHTQVPIKAAYEQAMVGCVRACTRAHTHTHGWVVKGMGLCTCKRTHTHACARRRAVLALPTAAARAAPRAAQTARAAAARPSRCVRCHSTTLAAHPRACHTHMCAHTYTHTRAHAHTHTHMRTHTHAGTARAQRRLRRRRRGRQEQGGR
jgi:hypothetical protein